MIQESSLCVITFYETKERAMKNCGYAAMFAKAEFVTNENPGLSLLKKSDGWKKAG